jgi:hypothetical protein
MFRAQSRGLLTNRLHRTFKSARRFGNVCSSTLKQADFHSTLWVPRTATVLHKCDLRCQATAEVHAAADLTVH